MQRINLVKTVDPQEGTIQTRPKKARCPTILFGTLSTNSSARFKSVLINHRTIKIFAVMNIM